MFQTEGGAELLILHVPYSHFGVSSPDCTFHNELAHLSTVQERTESHVNSDDI